MHQNSPRRAQRFVAINCGAIPETLLEAELFGHVRGAFTGAVTTRAGRFEEANRGTLFLDEIGTMTPALQMKLLRVIQGREVQRLGDTGVIKVDVRIIAATKPTWDARWPKASSAKISTTGSTSFRCTCRRCASARTMCRCWRNIS